MTTTTLTPVTGIPHRLAFGLRAIRAFGAAVVGVVLLGSYEEQDERAGVRDPRPGHVDRVDRVGQPSADSSSLASTIR
ncbi:hypothetical protein [Streptomyces sp. NPDC048623]|uniref:hypothetical protein n=1 Tax=Streptomyces sp. NPDC048623 TaxID=3155761 RepID=UPI00343D5F68